MVYGFGNGYARQLPAEMPAAPYKGKYLFHFGRKGLGLDEIVDTFGNTRVASPLVHDGLVYAVSQGGGLIVVDAKTGEVAYKKLLTDLAPRLTWVFAVGVCGSLVLGGKHIYITDNQGQTVIIEPGRTFKQVGKNMHMNFVNNRVEEGQSTPCFDGRSMFYRGASYLYCVREP